MDSSDRSLYAQAQTQARYPATSSAFSASAHPHEDWTQISDLAERRRIQNRIAQRNYRKKLKKRLEDLERKAASTSASPEQQPAQLPKQKSPRKKVSQIQTPPASLRSSREPSEFSQPLAPGMLSLPDGPLFTESFTRPLSTSPPPSFSYPMSSPESFAYTPFTSPLPYSTISPSFPDPASYSFHPFSATYPPVTSTIDFSTKSEYYPEVDLNPYSFSYAAVPSIEVSSNASFADVIPQTPPLSECHELYCAASPPESSFLPQTPAPFQASPRLTMV